MAEVGDKVSVHSKAGPRLGVVMARVGSMLRVRWESGDESSIVPGPGTLTVVGKERGPRSAKADATTSRAPRESVATSASKPTVSTKPASRSPARKKPQPTATAKAARAPKQAATPAATGDAIRSKTKVSREKKTGKKVR